jgi:CheY-like chemotaxis protein
MSTVGERPSRMLILVVEDEALLALDFAAELEDAGRRVLGPAHGVRDAILLLASRQPDLALVDLNLKSDGLQAGFGFSKYTISRAMPVVFVEASRGGRLG